MYKHFNKNYLEGYVMKKFTPATNAPAEIKRAHIKNHNLSILNYIYFGDEDFELICSLSKTEAFVEVWSPTRQSLVLRFRLDFDHIRQQDKSSIDSLLKSGPSEIFRGFKLDDPSYKHKLLEMLCCWPISTEYHSYKSDDAKHGNIVLTDYEEKLWPWHLKSKNNFDEVCKRFKLDLDYEKFINALSDVSFPCIPENYAALSKKGSIFEECYK